MVFDKNRTSQKDLDQIYTNFGKFQKESIVPPAKVNSLNGNTENMNKILFKRIDEYVNEILDLEICFELE